MHEREHSLKLYVPSRTCIVLCRDELLEGNITIELAKDFLSKQKIKEAELSVSVEGGDENVSFTNGKCKIPLDKAEFSISAGNRVIKPITNDELFSVDYPGNYILSSNGLKSVQYIYFFEKMKIEKFASMKIFIYTSMSHRLGNTYRPAKPVAPSALHVLHATNVCMRSRFRILVVAFEGLPSTVNGIRTFFYKINSIFF